mgnify:CR=1 FL=1
MSDFEVALFWHMINLFAVEKKEEILHQFFAIVDLFSIWNYNKQELTNNKTNTTEPAFNPFNTTIIIINFKDDEFYVLDKLSTK